MAHAGAIFAYNEEDIMKEVTNLLLQIRCDADKIHQADNDPWRKVVLLV